MIYIPPWQMKKRVKAGTLAVGSVVKLREGGTAVEFLVVNQGKPSDLYDDSCDGTWLLRKDIHRKRVWNTSNVNIYESSFINTWLNGDYFSSLGTVEQAAIKQVKIPYRQNGGSGGTDQSGANGLSCKVFLLSGYEVGIGGVMTYVPQDGAKLDYFNQNTGPDSKRIAYLNGSASNWGLRSPNTNNTFNVWNVEPDGRGSNRNATSSYGLRHALVLPSTALFDETTMILKGTA